MTCILVLAADSLDEHLLTYPFFHGLRAQNPGARIEVACGPSLRKFQFMDQVDQVHVLPETQAPADGLWSRLVALERLGRRLREFGGDWDEGYTLREALELSWSLRRAGVRRVHSFKDRVSEVYGGEAFWSKPPENPLDDPTPGELDRFDWKRAWPDSRQLDAPSFPYWVLAPGSADDSRQWPVERFLELARAVHERTGLKGVVVGGPKDAPLAARVCTGTDGALENRAAQGEFSAYCELLQNARFVVSNDSDHANLSVLCGTSTHVVWGARDAGRYHPRGPGRVRLLMQPVSCWPCNERHCAISGEKHLQCLRQISVSSVVDDVLEVWGRYGSGEDSARFAGEGS